MKTFRLPKEFTEKWLAALRSGDYKQSTFKLYSANQGGYCCLGIACRINTEAPLHGDLPHEMENDLPGDFPEQLLLKVSVVEELVKGFRQLGLMGILTGLNDGVDIDILKKQTKMYPNIIFPSDERSYSFSEIADFIEQNVELV